MNKRRRRLLRPKPTALHGALLPVTVDPTPIATCVPAPESIPGAIEIELPKARLTLRGRIDLDALQTVLAGLRSR